MLFLITTYGRFKNTNSPGTYAFYWGQKTEYTNTWFSLFTEKGEATDVALNFKKLWSGRDSSVAISSISRFWIEGCGASPNIYLQAEALHRACFSLSQLNVEDAEVFWELQDDHVEYLDASNTNFKRNVVASGHKRLSDLRRCKLAKGPDEEEFSLPFTTSTGEGAYRLFLSLKNKNGVVTGANLCFYVRS